MHHNVDNYTYLTQGPLHRVIIDMAIPTIISMLATGLYNIVDTYFVGKLTTQDTAAVGIVFSLMFFIQAVGFFFGHGSGNYISRELGAKRHKNADIMASTGFFFSFCFGMLITAFGEIFRIPLAHFLGSTPTTMPYILKFMSIILLGAPFVTSSLTLNNQMRLQGNASYAMYGIIAGVVITVVLDPILIFTCGMGIRGAAFATIIGQIASWGILVYMTHIGENIGIYFKNMKPSLRALKEIFLGGSPSLMRQGLASIATMALNVAASHYGDSAIAAMSIVTRISMLVFAVVVGLGQGFQPVCGFCYGAKLYRRLTDAFTFTVMIGTVFLVICSVFGLFFSSSVIGIFRNDPEVIKVGVVALRYQLISLPLNAFILVSNMLAQTCRKPWRANFLAAARQGLFFVPLMIILPNMWGLLGVEICQSVSDVFSFIATVPIIYYTFKGFKREDLALQAASSNYKGEDNK